MEARKVIASEAPPQFSSFSHLGILLERADGAEALLAQAKRLERGALEAQKVPRDQRQAL